MTSQEMGIDYFSIATDIKDDDKVFALKHHYATIDSPDFEYDHEKAWAAYGRFIDLLAAIYHEGFAVKITGQKQLRLSQQLGMNFEEFDHFIETCVVVGLFDARLFEDHKVLTSRGIQKRYFHAVKRRKGTIPAELKQYIINDEETAGQEGCEHDANTMSTSCEHDANNGMQDVGYKEKDRREENSKVNKTTEEERKGVSPTPNVENSVDNSSPSEQQFNFDDLSSKLSSHFSKPIDDRSHLQPYPLSCFSISTGKAFKDLMEQPHATPMEALCASFRQKTGTSDVNEFIQSIARKCPCQCSESPEQVSECFAVMMKGLKKFNRTKCHSPTPLVLKVLSDRQTVCK